MLWPTEGQRILIYELHLPYTDVYVFFEQVIFAMMVDREHKNVASVLGRDMRDNGYTRRSSATLLITTHTRSIICWEDINETAKCCCPWSS